MKKYKIIKAKDLRVGDIIVDRNTSTLANLDSYRIETCEVNSIDGSIQTVCVPLYPGPTHYYDFLPEDPIKREQTLKKILEDL